MALNPVAERLQPSIFGQMSLMAQKYQAINLAQGFPDFSQPEWLRELAREAHLDQATDQYAPANGRPDLRNNIARYQKDFYDLSLDADSEITVTVGATEAIFASIMALVAPGDEVIVLEPYYDSYLSSIELAGGKPVVVTVKAPQFLLPLKEIVDAITHKTKLIIFNNPHNPTGRVFDRDELQELAELIDKNDLYLISDEVYEFLTFDNNQFIPALTFPALRNRCLSLCSAGKTFGHTGWKVGWALGAPKLTHALRMVRQFISFSVHHPAQWTMARALKKLDRYIPSFQKSYQAKRDLLYNGLLELGLSPFKTQGTYFMYTPTAALKSPHHQTDIELAQELMQNKKVATIPPSPFYSVSHEGNDYLRFCFAKKDETLVKALDSLKAGPL